MSVHVIYYKDGAKMMRPVETRVSYLKLRGSKKQKATLKAVREGDEEQKTKLVQMNYSCLPNEDGTLKGSTRMSNTVGMDIDHISAEEMEAVKERILAKKEELGLLMLERSARGMGYHLVFRRRQELTQEENLRWGSELLGVEFDGGAKDITRVFFTTTDDEEELIFLNDGIFENGEFNELTRMATQVNCGRITRKLENGEFNGNGLKNGEFGELNEATQVNCGRITRKGENGEFNELTRMATQVNCGRITRKLENGEFDELNERGREPVDNSPCPAGRNPVNPINSSASRAVWVRVGEESCKSAGASVTALQRNSSEEGGHTPSPLRGTPPNFAPRWSQAVSPMEPGRGGEMAGAVADTKVQRYPTEYNGIAYKDIIAKYWELFNDGKEPQEGDRDTLTYQLACDLRHICGRNAEWLDQVIPCYDGFPLEEKRQKIQNALAAKSEGMPYRLKQVLAALKSAAAVKACGGTLTAPPEMPKKLPPLVKLLTSKVPDAYKSAVAAAVFPALGAHMHGVKFRYWDNVDHEATFMNVLIGRQSIGKSCIKKPIEYIMEDIRQRDIPNRQREAEWKQKNPGAKQKKDPRPTDICIQMLIDNLTDAVFNQRIVDAHNNGQRFLYTIVDEIDALKKVTSKGSVDEVGLLIRKAFDNSMAGQERVGADSVSGIAPLRWNFNASTTPPNARKFLWKMVNDGTLSRLDLSTIIIAEGDEDEAPVMGIYDDLFAQELKPYVDRLDAANGLIECPQAKKLALDIRQENRDAAQLYDSEAYRIFSYRANVIAWLKGMVLYVAQGYKWTKEIAEFVRWSEQYNLWCKMLYFGQQLEEELREEIKMQSQSGPQNLLDLLPDEFGREEYRLMRQRQGKSGDGIGTLRKWVSRGYLYRDEVTGRYCKTGAYLKKVKSLKV